MKAPEKIYVTECMLFMTNPEITLQGNGNKIEYTRTDAFIEKACEYLEPVFEDLVGYNCGGDLTNDFKNYMKGE